MKTPTSFHWNRKLIKLGIDLWPALLLVWMTTSAAMAQTGSVVTVNADKVLVLNGRKVFPIGFSPGPPTNGKTPTGGDALQELRDAGALLFRMTQTTDWSPTVISNQQAALDWAYQHGMYCWLNLRELSEFAAGDTLTEASLRSLVNQFKNHPGLGLWKNFDEAWWGGVSVANLKRGYDVIKQEDTNHPIVQTHAPRGTLADLQPYNVATDVLALDIYPVGYPPGANSLLTNKEISMVGDYAQFLDQVGNGQKQFWMIEQIAWSGATPPGKTLRFPTFAQERYMAYQAIINGARGLMYFGGNVAATLSAQDAALGWNWTFWNDVLKPVVRQLGDNSLLADALVTTNSSLPITFSGTTSPDLEFCVREAPPYLYILACKREGATVQVTFNGLPTAAGVGDLLYEAPRTVTATNGHFTDWFGPFEVHAYRFFITNQTPQSPVILSPPQSRTNYAGTLATFSVTAGGTGPLTYQWRKNSSNLSNGGNVSGVTGTSLTLSNVSPADAAGYDVIVTGFGSVTSAPPAILTVVTNPPSQLILYEPFNYPNIGGPVSSNTPANWTYGGSPPNDLSVVATNLSYPGLAASVGNSVTNGGAGLGVRRLLGPAVNSGTLWFSALFRINNLGFGSWNGASTPVGALTAPDNTSFRLAVHVKSNLPSGYVFGVQKSGTGVTTTFSATEFHAGDTVFLVGKYDFGASPNTVSLWINPNSSTLGAASEPVTGFISASTGTDGFTIDRFNMRQNTAVSVPAAMQWDELRIGLSWADVTPLAPSLSAVTVMPRPNSAIIKWTSAPANVAQIEYGVAPGLGNFSAPESAPQTSHSFLLNGLVPDTNYVFRIHSNFGTGEDVSTNFTFSTDVSLIVDNPQAQYSGPWTLGTSSPDKYGDYYQSAATTSALTPNAQAVYTPAIVTPGKYDVYLWYPQGANRTTNAQVSLFFNGGSSVQGVNQTTGGGAWQPLASALDYAAGTSGFAVIGNNTGETNKVVMADAMRWTYNASQDLATNGIVPGWWSNYYFGGPVDASLDPDGDGYSTYAEYVQGTDPTSAGSHPQLTSQQTAGGLNVVFSPVYGGRSYELLSSTNLAGGWLAAPATLTVTNGQGIFSVTNPGQPGQEFYRLAVRLTP